MDTLAIAGSGPKEKAQKARFKEFWLKEQCPKNFVVKTACEKLKVSPATLVIRGRL